MCSMNAVKISEESSSFYVRSSLFPAHRGKANAKGAFRVHSLRIPRANQTWPKPHSFLGRNSLFITSRWNSASGRFRSGKRPYTWRHIGPIFFAKKWNLRGLVFVNRSKGKLHHFPSYNVPDFTLRRTIYGTDNDFTYSDL